MVHDDRNSSKSKREKVDTKRHSHVILPYNFLVAKSVVEFLRVSTAEISKADQRLLQERSDSTRRGPFCTTLYE